MDSFTGNTVFYLSSFIWDSLDFPFIDDRQVWADSSGCWTFSSGLIVLGVELSPCMCKTLCCFLLMKDCLYSNCVASWGSHCTLAPLTHWRVLFSLVWLPALGFSFFFELSSFHFFISSPRHLCCLWRALQQGREAPLPWSPVSPRLCSSLVLYHFSLCVHTVYFSFNF